MHFRVAMAITPIRASGTPFRGSESVILSTGKYPDWNQGAPAYPPVVLSLASQVDGREMDTAMVEVTDEGGELVI